MRLVLACTSILLLAAGCGGGDDNTSCTTPGGAVSGAADSHCGATVTTTDPASCNPPDAGVGDPDAGPEEEAPVLFNSDGDDDDCKYHMAWTSTSVCKDADVFFTLTLTRKADGMPATGADPNIEAFLNDTHPAPNTNQSATEMGDGVYRIGPMQFDAAGQWTVRFHVYEECSDIPEDSPHGHAAFFLNVP